MWHNFTMHLDWEEEEEKDEESDWDADIEED